jgi:lysyl-tRNA synthetase, class II
MVGESDNGSAGWPRSPWEKRAFPVTLMAMRSALRPSPALRPPPSLLLLMLLCVCSRALSVPLIRSCSLAQHHSLLLSPNLPLHASRSCLYMSTSTPSKGGRRKPEEPKQTLEEIRQVRLGKVASLQTQGINPYAYKFNTSHKSTELQQLYQHLGNGVEDESADVRIAGRIMVRRVFGKLAFFELQDEAGSIQLYLDQTRLQSRFDQIKEFTDAGDIIGVWGSIKRTEKGELSVYARGWEMLTKSLSPLPDKFHGLTDVNKRYRQRHLDLITNSDVRRTLRQRAAIISRMRELLDSRGFLEVETPVLHTQAGGAEARPFETYHHALDMPLTLRIATELHLKRLVVGGIDRVYELGRIFRNEGLSTRHNPEFTSIELYQAYADYEDMMELTENMVSDIAMKLHGEEYIFVSHPHSSFHINACFS